MTSPTFADFLVTGARQLVTPTGTAPLAGSAQGRVASIPDAVVAATRERYLEAFRRLTGHDFAA